jgi:hypothetical protein
MATTIKNIETYETVTITVIDPKSGCDWSGDLIGNANDSNLLYVDHDEDESDYADCDYAASPETIAWWVDYCERYDRLDNELHGLLIDASVDDRETVHNMLCDAEFNDVPDAMEQAIELLK